MHSRHTHAGNTFTPHALKGWNKPHSCAVDEETERESVLHRKRSEGRNKQKSLQRHHCWEKQKNLRAEFMAKWVTLTTAHKIWMKCCKSGIYNDTIRRKNKSEFFPVQLWWEWSLKLRSWDETQGYNNSIYESILFVYYGSGCALCLSECACALVLLSLWGPFWALGERTWRLDFRI